MDRRWTSIKIDQRHSATTLSPHALKGYDLGDNRGFQNENIGIFNTFLPSYWIIVVRYWNSGIEIVEYQIRKRRKCQIYGKYKIGIKKHTGISKACSPSHWRKSNRNPNCEYSSTSEEIGQYSYNWESIIFLFL